MNPTCQHCNSPFTPNPKRLGQTFCSNRCRKITYQRRRETETTKEREARVEATLTREPGLCLACSTPLPIPRQIRQATCGRKCSYVISNRKKKECPIRRRSHDLMKKFKKFIKSGVNTGIRSRFLDYIGCSKPKLISHLQSFLPQGLCVLKNRTGWHIDHIIPMSRFNLALPEHLSVCFHHLNLRMTTLNDNAVKSDKLVPELIHPALALMASEIGVLEP